MILVSPRLLIRLMRHCRVVLQLTPELRTNTRLTDNRRMLGAELRQLDKILLRNGYDKDKLKKI